MQRRDTSAIAILCQLHRDSMTCSCRRRGTCESAFKCSQNRYSSDCEMKTHQSPNPYVPLPAQSGQHTGSSAVASVQSASLFTRQCARVSTDCISSNLVQMQGEGGAKRRHGAACSRRPPQIPLLSPSSCQYPRLREDIVERLRSYLRASMYTTDAACTRWNVLLLAVSQCSPTCHCVLMRRMR